MADPKTPKPTPKPTPKRGAAAAPEGTSQQTLIDMLAEEEARDSRIFRWSLVGAVVLHLVVFLVNFPDWSSAATDTEKKKPKIFVVKQVKFQPPPKPEIPQIQKPQTKRVPIPDPTPDEPEPIREEEPPEEVDFVPDDAFVPFVPEAPPAPEPEGPVRYVVGGDLTAPEKVSGPDPRYPEPARRARIEGAVILELTIGENGQPRNIKALRGLPLGLTEAAVDAVQKWRFQPATRQGQPVPVIYVLTVRFALQ